MYQIGQCIVYRNVGVCRVEAIGKLGFTSDKDKEYYTLQPLNPMEMPKSMCRWIRIHLCGT